MSGTIKKPATRNRETWLEAGIKALDKKFFRANGYELPEKLQASCGFPHGSSKAIGQCFSPEASADKTTHMFICPTQSNSAEVLDTLLHEMIHASVGTKAGHRGPFRKLALEFGMVGPMKSAHAEVGSQLHKDLVLIVEKLGDYPHAAMQKKRKKGKGGSGWVRLKSIEDDSYTLVISPKVLDAMGWPNDPWGYTMVLK